MSDLRGGLLLASSGYLVPMVVDGFGQGGIMAMLLALITARSPDVAAVREVSSMTQTVDYLISARPPAVAGSLVELTGSRRPSLLLFAEMGVVIVALFPIAVSHRRLLARA